MRDTKTRILDATERLLSERGLAAVSVRAITSAAEVNLGAVNYHFRSKEELIQAVLARRVGPINRERMEKLRKYETRSAPGPVPLEDLLDAFLEPMLRLGAGRTGFIHLLGRIFSEPSLDIERVLGDEFTRLVKRFATAFRRTIPELPDDELYWRIFFIIGSLAHTLAAGRLLGFLSGGTCGASDLKDAQRHLIRFAVAGLSNPGKRIINVRVEKGRP